MEEISYFDIGANLTHESFQNDFNEVINEAKKNNLKKNLYNQYLDRRYQNIFRYC